MDAGFCVSIGRLSILYDITLTNTETQYLNPDDHYQTYDLGLSSSLATLEYDIVAIDKTNRSKAQFIFQNAKALTRILNDIGTAICF